MISVLNNNDKFNKNSNSLNVSYIRNINIIFGNYPYPDIIHNLIVDIKNNLDPDMENYTNVKGGMTDWNYFIDKIKFVNFITIENAWGNEIKPGDSLDYHHHPCYHGILYLTKGCDLKLPELNLKITPEPGDYYIFPPEILHGFEPCEGEKNRYSLIFNIHERKHFEYNEKLRSIRSRSSA